MDSTTVTLIGYALFAISELAGILPIPANGLLHSLAIGLKNSLTRGRTDADIEMAQKLVKHKPAMASVVTCLEGNPTLIAAVNTLITNPQIINTIDSLVKDRSLFHINTMLINNPDIINDVKRVVIDSVNNQSLVQDQLHTEFVTKNIRGVRNVPN